VFLVPEKYTFFLQKWSKILVSKSTSSALFFSGNIDVFRGAETLLQSVAREGDLRGAQEKYTVSTVSLCIKNKPTPYHTVLPHTRFEKSLDDPQQPGIGNAVCQKALQMVVTDVITPNARRPPLAFGI
jgi:hypothetical protein